MCSNTNWNSLNLVSHRKTFSKARLSTENWGGQTITVSVYRINAHSADSSGNGCSLGYSISVCEQKYLFRENSYFLPTATGYTISDQLFFFLKKKHSFSLKYLNKLKAKIVLTCFLMQLWIVAKEITCQQCHSQKQRFSGQSHYMMCIWNTVSRLDEYMYLISCL